MFVVSVLNRCHGDGPSLRDDSVNKRRKMTQGKENKHKTTVQTDNQEKENACGEAGLPHAAEERGNRKLVSCSAGLQVTSADVAQNQTDLRDAQLENDDAYELPALCSLIVQRYEGDTCEGQFHGAGVALFEGGAGYKGMFSKGLMDGRGVFTQAGGLKYEGEFVCNMPMGQGTYTWPDGSSYKGDVYDAIRHGTGTYTCANNGVSYTGQWDRGTRHGKGVVYYNQDETSWYKGDWVKNNREGGGTRRYPSGNIYSGEWKSNLRHGEGTMRWLELGQQYVGMWQNGVQHGRGTHVWILRRADGSQYFQSNRYTGGFLQGHRHGQGSFYYACGAIYEGEWRKNEKHGKGKFTFEDGRVFEGEFVEDQMMTHKAPTLRPGSSFLGPDMALNIECLLEEFPERKRDAERRKVESEMSKQSGELRSVYAFYSRLGHAHSPENSFRLSRLQLWRLLKDCNIHHHGVTLTQMNRFARGCATTAEIHSPFTPVLLRTILSCLVVVAYHIYHKDMTSQDNLLAACFNKLMTDNICPNAKNVKGFLFRQPDCAAVAVSYSEKCWEVYQTYCRVSAASREEQTMTGRHLLRMFKDLHLLDNQLTSARLLQIIAAESREPSNPSACLDLEITFLEFFEVLLGSAEVKCRQVLPAGRDAEASETTNSPPRPTSDAAELSTARDVESQQAVKTKVNEGRPRAEGKRSCVPVERTGEGKVVRTRGIEAKDREVELWNQTIHQFFNHFFFPAFEHNQLLSRYMKEDAQRHVALQRHVATETSLYRETGRGGVRADE
ncbi:LOW QUALITY PROTEIN: radial spoke head 10 homolog B [Cottoperca gobio]|uniref:LOW QUALITY PROTEIN: radial spoke head 10 homolog B n=1 Tax=Cottoperca gobio TaxID=56716 RepID=A0A6J2RNV3_COTGO|nr:LOW QUALITY PROTEIN: radial spoke head 10 homolog B [Cottoperca gobio]